MKSILQALFSKWYRSSSNSSATISKNSLNSDSSLFEKRGNTAFVTAFISTLLFSVFGFIQKSCSSIFGLKALSQRQYFRVNALGVLTLILFFGVNQSVTAQISYATSGSSYTQNFDNLLTPTVPANNTAIASVLPTGWSFVEAGTNANATFRVDNGSSGSGDTFFDGATSSNERSLGAYASGSLTSQFGASFTNNTGATLTQFTLSYTGEQWKDGGSATAILNKLTFAYAVNPTSLTVGTYTNVTSLDFTALVNNTTADATTDGNASNRRTAITFTVTGISWPAGQTLYIRWTDVNDAGNDDNLAVDDLTFSALGAATPTITGAATATAFTATYGTASSAQTFSVSGTNLTANITATAPLNFEVSSDGVTYGATATFTQSGGTASGSLRVRIKAAAAVTGSYNSVNIPLTSTGATTVNITTAASGNSVSPVGLTISGVSGVNKTYNGTNAATLTGTPSYVGLVNSESFAVTGTPAATFASVNVGTGISITISGYTAPSTNYTVTQPSTSADITAKALTITGISANNKVFDGTDAATLSGTAALSGVVGADVVTLGGTPVATFASSAAGTGIAVNVTGYTISGTAAGNYTLTQPTLSADITVTPTPVISSALTASGTYGVATSAYTITATNAPDTYNATGLPAGLSVINGVISGTPTVTGTFNVTISATNAGGTGTATLVYTITAKALTVSGASVSSKTYDGTTTATIIGASLNGIVLGDTITVSGNGTFASANVGTAISVTPALSISGTNATNYTITQPSLTGDITAKALTVTATNVSKAPAQVLTGGTGSLAFSTNGLVSSETIGSVTITYGAAAGATGTGNTIGVYANQVTPSVATGGTFLASNYTITYASGSITVAGFGNGNLVVNRLGDGTTSLGSIAAPISLLEVTTTGTVVNTLSTGVFTGTNLLTDTATGTSNGNLSSNGQYLAVPGYNAAVGTTGVATTNTKATNVFGLGYTVATRVNFPATVYPSNNYRSVVPTSTSTFYTAGTPGGIWYYDGANFVNVCATVSNTRIVKIYNGNLYFTTATGAGIYQVGTGLPTTAGQTASLVFNTVTASPYGFAISPDGNTAYVADDSTVNANIGGGIQKWSKVTGTWVRQYTLGTIARSITVDFSSTNPIIYATTAETSNNKIIKVIDNGTALTSSDVTSAGANYIFRGVDFAPAAPSPKITASGSVAACNTTYGTASSITSFNLSGTNMLGAITITPPAGFEVSTTSDFSANIGTNASPITVGSSETIASTPIYVRIPGTTAASTYAGNIVLSSSFATSVNVATVSSVVSTKALTITGVSGVSRVYDGTTAASLTGTAIYDGVVNGDSYSVAGSPAATFADKNVGTAKAITVTGYTAPSSNYTVAQPTAIAADITAKDLTVSNVTANNKSYDGTVDATLSGTLEGVVAPDNVTLLATGEFEFSFQSIFFETQWNIVNVAFLLSGNAGDLANYNLVQPTVNGLTADIYPKELTVTGATASDKVYDGTTAAVVIGTLNGVVAGESVFLVSSGTFASAEIGTNIAVTPTWALDGDTFNYTLIEPTVSLTANITSPSAPSITSATTATATYGDTTTSYAITATGDATSYNATGLPPGLSINTTTGEITGSPSAAGVYSVALSATNSGGTGFATLSYTINTINVTIPDAIANNKQYDGTTAATITGTLTGAIAGDDVSFNGAGAFDSAVIGSNIFVTSNIILTGSKAANYTLTQPSGLTANITQKVLTVSASVSNKVYDGTITATVNVDATNGIVGSEIVNVSATGTFDTANVGNGKNVTVAYSLNGTNASNYTIVTPVTLTGNITPKPLTYTATADNKVFDGNTNATVTVTAITGVVSPDAVTITGTGTFASSAIANGIVVSNIALTLGGAQAANYSIEQPSGTLTANITEAPTVLTAGDIAVIGYNTSGTPDSFSIVVLKDLTSGTQFFVNDNELASTTATSFTDLGEMEASFTVKSGQTIPAGTVIVLPWGAAAVSTASYDWSSTASAGFGASNDEIYIYTAPSITATTPTLFLYFAKLGTSPSAIPASLETSTTGTGTTAISPTAAALRYNTTTNIYNSCKQILLNEIGKTGTANWTTTGSAAVVATDWTFTVLPTCPTPSITTNVATLAALTTEYGSPSATTSFTVTGTYLTSDVALTAPAGFEISTNATSGFANSLTLTQISGSVNSTIFVRLTSLTTVLLSPYSGNITITNTGATTVNVAASGTVTPKAVTITGLLVNNKVQSIGNFTATLTGTPVLNGVLSADSATVALDSSAVTAVFAQDTAGTTIPVTVSGYALTGAAAGNYALVQPSLTGTITSVASPVITSALTFSAVYGTQAAAYTITATSDEAYAVTGYNATGLPAGLTVNTTTGVISGTPTATPGTYNITISATNIGGTTNALLVYTITKKVITVTATAANKVYNATTAATITVGTITGVVGTDIVTVTGGGTFDTKNVGTAKSVTAALVLGGAQAGNYSITQPSGLTADVTPFTVTLSGAAAQSKVFDGNTNAVITATLVGIIAGDVVTFNGTGTFATSALGQAIAVTSTATLIGTDAGNYTFVQPTTLTANITDTIIYLNTFTGISACPTNGNVPTMVTNSTGTPLSRNTITCNATANVLNSTTLNATASVSNSSYIEFSASATAGNKLSVTSVSFFRQASNSAPNKLEVRYSTDGFVTSTAWGAAPVTPIAGNVITWDFSDFTTPTGGTVTFRLYPYGTTRADLTVPAAAASGTFRLDDVTIYGKVLTGPTAAALSLTGSDTFCSGTATTVKVDVTGGTAPYTVAYSNGSTTNYVSGTDATVIPTASPFTLLSVTDANGITLTSNLSGSINFNITPTTSNTTTASACDSYTWSVNGQTYTTSGTYTVVNGCNTQILALTITPSTSNTTTASACDTYTWSVNNQAYTTSGTYSVVTGCHTEVLNLTITPSTSTTTTTSSCGDYLWSVNGQTYTTSGTYTYVSGCHTEILNLTVATCSSTLNLKVAIQGYYDTDAHAMRAVKANQGVGTSTTAVDDITVELRDVTDYHVVASVTASLQTDGTAVCTYATAPTGSFYVSVAHRNSIQVMSATPVTVGATPAAFDFTTAASKAFGDNQVLVDGVYTMYSGDFNQDGFVDIFDYPAYDAANQSGGAYDGTYVVTDLNGDGYVDIFDFPIYDSNNQGNVQAILPY